MQTLQCTQAGKDPSWCLGKLLLPHFSKQTFSFSVLQEMHIWKITDESLALRGFGIYKELRTFHLQLSLKDTFFSHFSLAIPLLFKFDIASKVEIICNFEMYVGFQQWTACAFVNFQIIYI